MQRNYNFYVYILTNYGRNVFYVGFTNNITRRIIEHKHGFGCKFTEKYKLKYLIYFEESEDVYSAIEREKELKKWRRDKKLNLVKSKNPLLEDLSEKIFTDLGISSEEMEQLVHELRSRYNRAV
jgi:putative endonuclease